MQSFNKKTMSDQLVIFLYKSDFIQFIHDLIHVYSLGAGGVQRFDINRNLLSLQSSVASFRSQMTIVTEKSIVLPFSHTKA